MTDQPQTDRTDTARAHDDHQMIDAAVANADPQAVAGSAGGALQTDIGSKADLKRAVEDPDGMTRPEKSDDIAHGDAYPADRGNNRQ